MKIYLASFLEPQNFGPGRKLAVSWDKPDSFEVDGAISWLIPPASIIREYKNMKVEGREDAGLIFQSSYEDNLNSHLSKIKEIADSEGKSLEEVIGLSDGDTLLSYERSYNSNYRPTIANLLISLGYEVNIK